MSSKINKGLGRGFETLIPTDLLDESFDPTASQDHKLSDLRQIRINNIKADPDQPRKKFDDEALADLTESIRVHGVLQPIIVVPGGKDSYKIIAGERRYRASVAAGLDTIPALVRTMSSQNNLEVSLIENLQRQDLNALETATAYQKLKDQFNLNLEEIGKRLGNRSVSSISNTLRILKLPKVAKEALAEGLVLEGQVRPLIGLSEQEIEKILPKIIQENWSARQVEKYVGGIKNGQKPGQAQAPKFDYTQETNQLGAKLASRVSIQANLKGGGKITIQFKDSQDLERIKRVINGS